MTDEMNIQQRPSAVPYLAGGALVGGVGSYFGAPKIETVRKWISEPAKYNSYEDLVKEAKDTTTFSSAIEKASAEEKPLMEKLAAAVKTDAEAVAKWDADFEKFKEAYKEGGLAPLEEGNELLTKQKELETKIANLEKETAAGANTKTSEATIKQLQGKIAEETKKADKLNKDLNKELRNIAGKKFKGQNVDVKAEVEKLVNSYKLNKDTAKAFVEKCETNVDLIMTELEHAEAAKSTKALGKAYTAAEKGLANANEALNIYPNDKTKQNIIDNYLKNKETKFNKGQFDIIVKREKEAIETAKSLRDKYTTYVKDVAAKANVGGTHVKGKVAGIFPIDVTLQPNESTVKSFVETLTKEEAEAYKKILNEANTTEAMDDIIKALEKREAQLANIETLAANQAKAKDALTQAEGNIRRYIGDKNFVVDEATGELKYKNGTKVKISAEGAYKAGEVKIPNSYLENLEKGLQNAQGQEATLTKEQLAAKTKELETLRTQLKGVEGDITKAREALPRNAAKTQEQLMEEFVKKNGARSEIENKTVNSVKDDLARFFEGKINNKKFAAAVAGTAAVGAILALALRPSNKQA